MSICIQLHCRCTDTSDALGLVQTPSYYIITSYYFLLLNPK